MKIFNIHPSTPRGKNIEVAWINFFNRHGNNHLLVCFPLFHIVESFYDIFTGSFKPYMWVVPFLVIGKTGHSRLQLWWGLHPVGEVSTVDRRYNFANGEWEAL